MIQKIFKKIKSIWNYWFQTPRDYISFFLPIVIAMILVIPVDYTITIGGGINNVDKKIVIKDGYKSEGSFNISYVKEFKGTVFTYLLGKVVPGYKINKLEDVALENENIDDYEFRGRMFFTTSTDSALKVAFTKAGREIKETKQDIYVIYKEDYVTNDIHVGDKIVKVNGVNIDNVTTMEKVLTDYNDEKLILTVLRNKKQIDIEVTLYEDEDGKKVGIYLAIKRNYETNPKVTFKFGSNEEGSSAGLMMTLSIYNKLVEEDITKGYKISGTGTIDENGVVGEIGGIPYKLKGAVKKHSDVFLCPAENYEEAISEKEKNNYNIKIYKIATFDDALEVLKDL